MGYDKEDYEEFDCENCKYADKCDGECRMFDELEQCKSDMEDLECCLENGK